MSEVEEKWNEWLFCYDLEFVIGNFFDGNNCFEVCLSLWILGSTVEGPYYVVSLEFITVVELNAFMNLEDEFCVGWLFVGFYEPWLNFTVFVKLEESVVNVCEHFAGVRVVTIWWVEANDVETNAVNEVCADVFFTSCCNCCVVSCCAACFCCRSSCCWCFFIRRAANEHGEHHNN